MKLIPFCSDRTEHDNQECWHDAFIKVSNLSINHPLRTQIVASGSLLQSDSASPYTTLGGKPKPTDGCAKNPFSAWSCCSCFVMVCGTCSPEDTQAQNSGPFCRLQPLFAICFQCANRLLPISLSFFDFQRWGFKFNIY